VSFRYICISLTYLIYRCRIRYLDSKIFLNFRFHRNIGNYEMLRPKVLWNSAEFVIFSSENQIRIIVPSRSKFYDIWTLISSRGSQPKRCLETPKNHKNKDSRGDVESRAPDGSTVPYHDILSNIYLGACSEPLWYYWFVYRCSSLVWLIKLFIVTVPILYFKILKCDVSPRFSDLYSTFCGIKIKWNPIWF